MQLAAVDVGGQAALLEKYTFVARPLPPVSTVLVVGPGWQYDTTFSNRTYVNP